MYAEAPGFRPGPSSSTGFIQAAHRPTVAEEDGELGGVRAQHPGDVVVEQKIEVRAEPRRSAPGGKCLQNVRRVGGV